jgi:glycosyltransferase involved in cell wall biosynthesis
MNQANPELTVVMPCLNEELTLAACIQEILGAVKEAGIDSEIVIADNGSTDGSQDIAINSGARVVHVSEKGYGHAIRGGISAAKGRYVIMGDADGSYDFTHIPRIIALLRTGHDLVMGNRFLGGIQPGAMPWKNRYIGNPILSYLGRLFFNTELRDFHCGFRGFSIAAYNRMQLRTTGMEFASEMVIKATTLGLKVAEVPTTLRPDGRNRPPHLRPWRDGWRHLRFMLLFSPRWLFFYPGLGLIISGSVLGGLLLNGPIHFGRATLDVHTLLFCALSVLIGFQAVSFAGLSKFFAIRAGLRSVDTKFTKWWQRLTLEGGLIAGTLFAIAGLVLWMTAFWLWREGGFGPLDPSETLRWVIPGALGLALGSQMILTSFFLGVLRLDTREDIA